MTMPAVQTAGVAEAKAEPPAAVGVGEGQAVAMPAVQTALPSETRLVFVVFRRRALFCKMRALLKTSGRWVLTVGTTRVGPPLK